MIGIEPASRERAALLAGRILCSMVPEDALAKMASGQERITDHPEAAGYIKALRSAAISGCLPMENETIHLDQPLSFRVLPAKQQGEQKLPL